MNLANKISDAADQVMGVVAGFWKPEGGEVDIEVALGEELAKCRDPKMHQAPHADVP